MVKKKFTFDDTIEYDKNELKPDNDLHSKTDRFSFNDELKENQKKDKPKGKLNKWRVAIVAIIALIVVFLVYIFVFAGSNNGPVYGERCAKLLSIDKSVISEVETEVETNDKIQDIAIKVDCRTIKITYQFIDNVSSNDAKSLVEKSIHTLDDKMGYLKDDEGKWSQLLNKANGRLQYDVDIIVKSNGEEYPLFGTKHAGVDEISYTGQTVKDQASADRAIKRQAEVDAANNQ